MATELVTDHKEHIALLHDLIMKYGMECAGESVFRLTALRDDNRLSYDYTWEQEIAICERKLANQKD